MKPNRIGDGGDDDDDGNDLPPLISSQQGEGEVDKSLPELPSQEERSQIQEIINKRNKWNTRHQQVLLLPKTTAKERLRYAIELKKLYDEFDESAIKIAKELVTESESSFKKYPPVPTNGIAGGQKFIVNDTLFKFARDWKQIYGGDSNAGKAAGHELLCVKSVLQLEVPDIFTPLITIIDYAGFRITAVSLLPIDSTTLVYGSDDGGKTVVSKSPKVAQTMKDIALKLNLKEHKVNDIELFTPGDLEVHHGFDNKDYIIDTTRLFPCQTQFHSALFIPVDETKPCSEIDLGTELFVSREEWSQILKEIFCKEFNDVFVQTTPIGRVWSGLGGKPNRRATALIDRNLLGDVVLLRRQKASSLCQMLRPEFVRENKVPLCSDAWTKFQSNDPAKDKHDEEVSSSTKDLIRCVIPKFADYLEHNTVVLTNHNELGDLMHRHGINIRFMGLVRRLVTQPYLKSLLLTDMISRVIKEKLRKELRMWVGFKEESCKRLIVDYFNRVFGRSPSSDEFWRSEVTIGIQHKFIHGLSREEAMSGYDIRKDIKKFSLLNRISEITGVVFRQGTYKRLFEHSFLFDSSAPFSYCDLKELKVLHRNAFVIPDSMKTFIHAAVSEEEKTSPINVFDQANDFRASTVPEVVHQERVHYWTERVMGADSKEAIASLFDLARAYLHCGNTTAALDTAVRGLSYGEALFGVFSELVLDGVILTGEIHKEIGDYLRAVESYNRAKDIAQGLYKHHPIIEMINTKIHTYLKELETTTI